MNNYHKIFIIILLNCSLLMGQQERTQVSKLKVTTLSTMLVNGKGLENWNKGWHYRQVKLVFRIYPDRTYSLYLQS
jgi:hypothetical protein